jgi:hypothetical protein
MTKSNTSTLHDAASSASIAQAERALNAALVDADISRSYEEFIELVDQFYAEDVEVRSDSSSEPLIGRARVISALLTLLVPLHVMAEIGGLSVTVTERPIAGDLTDERHSQWSIELVGVTGRAVRVSWSVRRRWKQSLVVASTTTTTTRKVKHWGPATFRTPRSMNSSKPVRKVIPIWK